MSNKVSDIFIFNQTNDNHVTTEKTINVSNKDNNLIIEGLNVYGDYSASHYAIKKVRGRKREVTIVGCPR